MRRAGQSQDILTYQISNATADAHLALAASSLSDLITEPDNLCHNCTVDALSDPLPRTH